MSETRKQNLKPTRKPNLCFLISDT